jgi:hypothetical protein
VVTVVIVSDDRFVFFNKKSSPDGSVGDKSVLDYNACG